MCFDSDSLPPIPVISGAAVSHDDLVLEACRRQPLRRLRRDARPAGRDGNRHPSRHPRALPLLRGAGAALRRTRAPQRSRSTTSAARPGSTSAATTSSSGRTSQATTAAGIQADVAAAVARLREQGATRIFTVGFCFGGRQSWLGGGVRSRPRRRGRLLRPAGRRPGRDARADAAGVRDRGADPGAAWAAPTRRSRSRTSAAFERALAEAGVEHEVEIYDGAPHSFFDRKFEQFADASEDAWGRVLAFVAQHGGSTR